MAEIGPARFPASNSHGTSLDRQTAPIGVLMLDTHFKRLPGDIGNGRSWKTPVLFKTVKGANPDRVVFGGAQDLLVPFLQAAQELIDEGAKAITTSCGFLALYQREMAAALSVPVFASSLLQAPVIERILPAGKKVGILTFSARSLTKRHLLAVGADPSTAIFGVAPDSAFAQYFGDHSNDDADVELLKRDVLDAVRIMLKEDPSIGAILCECTNLPPFSAAIARESGLPVFDIMGFVEWVARSLCPLVTDEVTDFS
ncbi:aspartate/glutamate racemase family protein [uncultured Cohaesibacter sp.]|uniref:aspartate/glutamate racemase family protein n=1 Tax=uncultured Cohaesibacter sp. TaxID=1002546 RepID=UPI0029315879|nr:aspartate/glutamate racemase family protein [uncultured Cohaesibacter sp.]